MMTEDREMTLIMIDDPLDWHTILGPQYIIGKDNQLIKVFIGYNPYQNDENTLVGIWCRTIDYNMINHDDLYILINDEGFDQNFLNKQLEDMKVEIEEFKNQYKDSDPLEVGRPHIHLGPNSDDFKFYNDPKKLN